MEPHIIVPPNLNGKVYREFFPPQKCINTFLDFVDIIDDQILIGSSNLNGRYWDGSICHFKEVNTDSSFDFERTHSVECLDVGVTDGKILPKSKKVIIAQDSGHIKLFDIEENLKLLKIEAQEHDEHITELSMADYTNFVTSSADACIKVWVIGENDDITCTHTYNYGHLNLISSVSANTTDSNLFASCSFDRTALLWDKRTQEAGKVLYENEFCALTKIEWHPIKSNLVAISTSAGDVYLVDTREPKEFIAKNSCFNRSIHRTRFNAQGLLAVCADDSKVLVLDCANEDMKVVYVDDRHSDFVRGLSWKNNVLVTCGWDKQVLFHYL